MVKNQLIVLIFMGSVIYGRPVVPSDSLIWIEKAEVPYTGQLCGATN